MKIKFKPDFLEAREKYHLSKCSLSMPGTAEWLVGTEIKYGGMVTNVKRNKVSPKDPRTNEQLRSGGMIGGDRMLYHGYAQKILVLTSNSAVAG